MTYKSLTIPRTHFFKTTGYSEAFLFKNYLKILRNISCDIWTNNMCNKYVTNLEIYYIRLQDIKRNKVIYTLFVQKAYIHSYIYIYYYMYIFSVFVFSGNISLLSCNLKCLLQYGKKVFSGFLLYIWVFEAFYYKHYYYLFFFLYF